MPKYIPVEVFCNGGIVSPGDLRKIVMTAQHLGAQYIQLGSRQQIRFEINEAYLNDLNVRFHNISHQYNAGNVVSYNIVTSGIVKDILSTRVWLSEGYYRELLNNFDYQPKIPINIVDPEQSAIPLFTGILNFIASSSEDYWNIYFSLPQHKQFGWLPVMIHSDKIPDFSLYVEKFIQSQTTVTVSELMTDVYELDSWNFKKTDTFPRVPDYHYFPQEGVHITGDKFWLGVFNTKNTFSISLIDAICVEALESNVGAIYISPWDSLLLKNIPVARLPLWEHLLGMYDINTGHASHELCWNISEWDINSTLLRAFVNDYFRSKDKRTEGLILGVNNEPNDIFYSIKIVEEGLFTLFGRKFFPVYHIRYKENFNPNEPEDKSFMDYVQKKNLPEFISYLTEEYFSKQKALRKKVTPVVAPKPVLKHDATIGQVYQCSSCLTIYDPEYGDPDEGIVPGTYFNDLLPNYCCPVCSNSKKGFNLFIGQFLKND
ncbi:MAG: rubredoxin [Cytophagales bacterium]|nr:rubredoxin [Cytophaga sp.]